MKPRDVKHADVLLYSAFTRDGSGGNPAGVVLDATGLGDADMQAIAARVGFSETAFLTPIPAAPDRFRTRYFSPRGEVTFCGHATVAAAAAYGDRHGSGSLRLTTLAGDVHVEVGIGLTGRTWASLTSVETITKPLQEEDRRTLLTLIGWAASDLDAQIPPRVAYAGAWHPVLAAADAERLDRLEYDFDAAADLMRQRSWTTISMIHRHSDRLYQARNAFAVGGVVEDPATGAAAAALAGYLRELRLVPADGRITVLQGHHMGSPSELQVTVPSGRRAAGISVAGEATEIRASGS